MKLIGTRPGSLVNLMAAALGSDLRTVVRTRFHDGSFAEYTSELALKMDGPPDITFEYMKGSGVDSDGNTIPESPRDLAFQRGGLSGENIDHFGDLAERFGFTVTALSGPQAQPLSYECGSTFCRLTSPTP